MSLTPICATSLSSVLFVLLSFLNVIDATLSPSPLVVNSFKRADLNLDIETGNTYVSTPYPNGFSGNFSDNSYFVNTIKYNNYPSKSQ